MFTMEAKRWFHVVLFSFILVGLFANVLIRDSNDAQHTHIKDQMVSRTFTWIKNMVLDAATGMWELNEEIPPAKKPHIGPGLSPNLSSCHKSYAKDDYMVYCCPPNEADEPVIDFKFPDPSLPHRTRRPIHLRDKDYLAKYTRAITIMKSLPYEDPRSFARQADMHCIYCTGAYNQKYANVSLNIHRSWFFFPWHRMLIYFHERILAKLIDDESFSLSFWQWDAPEGMVVPEIYMKEPFLDKQRSDIHVRPNKIVDVNYSFKNNNNTPQVQISKNLAFMYNQMVSGAKKVELFMGCVYKPGMGNSCDGPGTVELAPHNSLHSWVGRESNRYLENMGVFYSAARDPLFWAHHPNIDRLWEVWRELRGYEPAIVDPDWLDSYFFFHDEYAQLVRIKIRDVLNITMLGYSYQKVDLPWLNARPKPSIDPSVARHILNTRDNQGQYPATQGSDFRPKGRTLDTTFTVKVFRPNDKKQAGKEEEVVLVVYGIDIKEDVFVKLDVYVNAIDGESLGSESREFAGTFVNVPKGVRLVMNEGDEKEMRKATLKLGISELLEDLQASEDEFIWVTVVPRGNTGASTSVDGLRIEYMK